MIRPMCLIVLLLCPARLFVRMLALALLRLIGQGKTQFARYLLSTLPFRREESLTSAAALFPLPLKFERVFYQRSCKNAAASRRLAVARCTHLVVMTLNFIHAGCRPVPLRSLQRPLSLLQAQA